MNPPKTFFPGTGVEAANPELKGVGCLCSGMVTPNLNTDAAGATCVTEGELVAGTPGCGNAVTGVGAVAAPPNKLEDKTVGFAAGC